MQRRLQTASAARATSGIVGMTQPAGTAGAARPGSGERADAGTAAPRRGPSRQQRARRRRIVITAVQVAIVVIWLGSWQLCADHGITNRLFTSAPSDIWTSLWDGLVHGQTLSSLGTTLYETLVGFFISVIIGTLFGIAIYASAFFRDVMQPFIAAVNSLPRLALVPLFILWFGIGSLGRIALIITITTFVILINTFAGLQSASRDHLLLARTLGARRWQTYLKFMLPSAAPTLFAGLQLGLTYSFLGAVISELISGGDGLGAAISEAQSNFDTAGMFADIFVIGIVAAVLSSVMRLAERYLLAWREVELRGFGGAPPGPRQISA
jgi:NitT/TauT family transport system permease protein